MADSGTQLAHHFLCVGLCLSPGRDFDPTGGSDYFMRINIACPRGVVEDALARLRRAALAAVCVSSRGCLCN